MAIKRNYSYKKKRKIDQRERKSWSSAEGKERKTKAKHIHL